MTDDQKWLSRRYLLYRACTNLWFFGSVWLYFYRLFITDQQVGILDGMAFAIGLLAEIPSGALADKFGRDRMVRLGQVLIASGILMQAVGSSFMPFFVGQSVLMVGMAFVSGADEALFFERLKFKRDSIDWRKLVTRGAQVALIATLTATVLGGLLHGVHPRLPWLLNGFAFIVAAIVIWPVRDGRPRNARGRPLAEIKSYLQDIKTGFAQFRLPALRLYVPLILAVQALFYTYGYGLLRMILLDRFTFSPFLGTVAVASAGIITVILLALLHKYANNISEKRVLVLIGLAAAASLLMSLADIGLWGYLVILALYAGEHIMQPFMSEILNKHAPEAQRATVLSVASFLRMLPYVCLAPIIGYLSTYNQLQYFFVPWAVLVAGAVLLYILSKKRDERIHLQQ